MHLLPLKRSYQFKNNMLISIIYKREQRYIFSTDKQQANKFTACFTGAEIDRNSNEYIR